MFFDPARSATASSADSRRRIRRRAAAVLLAAAAVPLTSTTLRAGTGVRSELDTALVLLAEQAAANDAELLSRAGRQFSQGQYEDAQITLQQIKVDNLPASDRQKVSDLLNKVQNALTQRQAARAEFEKGEQALAAKNYEQAIGFYRAAMDNRYADQATRSKAASQLAVAEAALQSAKADLKALYQEAVDDYRGGRLEQAREKFTRLESAKYKPGLFQRSCAEYLADIDRKLAAAAAGPSGKDLYDAGVAAMDAGDYAAARKKFTEAREKGYRGAFLKPTVDEYLSRIDKIEREKTAATQPSGKELYEAGVAAFNAGDYATAKKKFTEAKDLGFRAPLFKQTPAQYLAKIERIEEEQKAAAAAAAEQPTTKPAAPETPAQPAKRTPKDAYEAGVAAYRAGDYATARAAFLEAEAAGYNPGLFRDRPSKYLAMIDAKEGKKPAEAPAQEAQARPAAPPPATAPALTPEEEELLRQARVAQAKRALAAFEAERLVEKAKEARAENRLQDAYVLYREAKKLDPNNREAVAGEAEMKLLVTGATDRSMLDAEINRRKVQKEAIRWSFDQAIGDAKTAIERSQWKDVQQHLDEARVARESAPELFTREELAEMRAAIDATEQAMQKARAELEMRQAQQAQETIIREAREREAIAREQKRRTVTNLVKTAKQLVYEGQYKQALGVINQILEIDPTNDYAIGVKQFVNDYAIIQEQRKHRETFDREFERQLNATEEAKIPYMDLMVYPPNWPDISDMRDKQVAAEKRGGAAEAQAISLLNRPLPEVRFDAVALSDVIDFFHDVTGANLFVNWRALEAAGIQKTTPVTARLRDVKFSKALSTVLADAAGGSGKLSYTVDEGVITISTMEDLNKNTITQVYDIRDLLVIPPDVDEPPSFGLQRRDSAYRVDPRSSAISAAARPSGPFASPGGTPGTGSYPGAARAGVLPSNSQRTEELVREIMDLIKDTVDRDSWIDNGGKVGSLRYLSGQLIVTQTPDTQRQVVSLLDRLRETRAIQVCIETRFLTVQRNFLEDVGLDLDFFFNINNPVNWSPIPVQQNSAAFTLAPQTPVPGTIGAGAQPAMQIQGSFLDDFQVNFLIRATQAAQHSTILTAPRVTVFNAQRAFIIVGTQQAYVSDLEAVTAESAAAFNPVVDTVTSGVQLLVQPTVSADRKYVTLSITPQLSQLVDLVTFAVSGVAAGQNPNQPINPAQPLNVVGTGNIQLPLLAITSLQTIVSVPDGGTLLLGGQTLAGDVEVEEGVPVLSKIPFLKRLFTNRATAKDEQILLILVKPTIIIQREIEQQQFPLLHSKRP